MLKKFGDKQMYEVDGPNGRRVMVSYQTPVVVCDNGRFFVTNEYFSRTTTKHINHYLKTMGAFDVVRVDPVVFERLRKGDI